MPLNVVGIAFGTAGIAGTWTVAASSLGAPGVVGEVLWIAAAVAWVVVVVRYLAGAGGVRTVTADLRSPVLGPFGALYPVVGSLLAAHLAPVVPTASAVAVWATAGASTVFGAWFVASLLTSPRDPGSLHGGYLLPTVAATLLTAQSLAWWVSGSGPSASSPSGCCSGCSSGPRSCCGSRRGRRSRGRWCRPSRSSRPRRRSRGTPGGRSRTVSRPWSTPSSAPPWSPCSFPTSSWCAGTSSPRSPSASGR
nr:hypothetical protein [Cellulosimicrobium sp. CUA-896]